MKPPRLGRSAEPVVLLVCSLAIFVLPAEAQVWDNPGAMGQQSHDSQYQPAVGMHAWNSSNAPAEPSNPWVGGPSAWQPMAPVGVGAGNPPAWTVPEDTKPASASSSGEAGLPAAGPLQLPSGVRENRYVTRRGDGTFALLPDDSVFKLDYRLRWLTDSHTSYEFGTPELPPDGWTPLSRLVFSLNSLWHGVSVGWERPGWNLRFEWLTPMQRRVQGDLEDYDWLPPNPNGSFTDLGVMRERWTDAQMLDLSGQFRLVEKPLGLPLEVWPGAGFRWQRLGLMASDPFQLKEFNVWQEYPWSYYGDVISFKQEYFVGYVGGEIRATIEGWRLPPLQVTFRGDWGWTDGFNIDHHLIREGDRYTKESTHGDTWRVGLTFETLLRRCLGLGFEVDYLEFATKGRHHLINIPLEQDLTWDHGVRAWSNQTWLTAFVRLRI